MQTFVSVFNASSFINFQEYLPVWFKQLKHYAYSIDQVLNGRGVNATKGGNHNGFILDLIGTTTADDYFKTKVYPKVQTKVGIVAGADTVIAANLVPGSVSIALTNGDYLVDNGQGSIRRVDGNNTPVGTINYGTGAYNLNSDLVVDDATAWVNYAVIGTNTTYGVIDGTVSGFDNGLIPNGQCFFTLQVMVSTKTGKAFVGFSSNDAGKQEIAKLLGDSIPESADGDSE